MSEADLVAAVFRALTGGRHDDGGGDLHAVLADEGWDAAALRSHARAVVAGGGVIYADPGTGPGTLVELLEPQAGTRELFAKVSACGCAAEPNAAQTGSGSWRTADSKIDWCDSSFFNCSAKVLMVRSLKEKEVLRYKAVVLRTGCIP